MADSATIVAASLSDKELRDSVTKLVNYFDDQMKIMAVSTNITVDSIEKKLKSLDKIKIDSGSAAEGGSSRRTSSLKQEEQQVKSVATSYDGLAKAQQTAIGSRGGSALKKDIDEAANSYSGLIQQIERTQAKFDISPIQNLRMRQHELEAGMQTAANEAAKAKKDVDELNAAIANYRATLETLPKNGQGFSNRQAIQKEINDLITLRDVSSVEQQKWEAASRQLASQYEVVKNEIRQIGQALIAAEESEKHVTTELDKQLQKINEISSRKTATQTYRDAISMETNSLEKAESKLAVLQALKTKILNTDLLSKKDTESLTSYISYTTALVERMRSKSAKSTKDDEDAIRKAAEAEKRWADNIVARGQIAQETSRKLIRMLNEEAQAGGKGLMGMFKIDGKDVSAVKELEKAIKDMQMQYNQMSDMDKDSAIGRALKRDIENAKIASGVISGYNKAASGVFNRTSDSESFKIRNYETLKNVLKELTNQYNQVSIAEIKAGNANHIIDAIQRTSREAQQLQSIMNRPTSFASAMKLSEKTLDDLSYKIRQLQSYKLGIDLQNPNAANEIKQVDDAILRLQKDMDNYMGKVNGVVKSNNMLGRSWNYMKNRLAFYFTVGASTQFIKNLIEVRSQYEMNERALGILINSAERGTQIFNELSQMALVSPYTLIELSNAAKQLTAYDIAAKDVIDTTRRLADMASAVGVPMERLTYALGQIKAYGYLNSRDARMFANAGIPLVRELSKYYSELEGKVVSVGDVYDRMKKKAIDYNSVMAVVTKMTDEGGKFFDFQAKMADTLKVRLANLTLAWNNMLNDIGASQQGVLTSGIGILRDLFLHWQDIYGAIQRVVLAIGLWKGAQALALLAIGELNTKMGMQVLLGEKLQTRLSGLAGSTKNLVSGYAAAGAALLFVVADAIMTYQRNAEEIEKLNKVIVDGARESANSIYEFIESAEMSYARLSARTGKLPKPDAEKTWDALREQIELSAISAKDIIPELIKIEDLNERVTKAFNLAERIAEANNKLIDLDGKLDISQDSILFGLFGEGLVEDIDDFNERLRISAQTEELLFKSTGSVITDIVQGLTGFFNDMKEKLGSSTEEAEREIKNFAHNAADAIKDELGEEGLKDSIQVNEAVSRVLKGIEQQFPQIKGQGKALFESIYNDIMATEFEGAVDKQAYYYKLFLERLKKDHGSAFQGVTEDIDRETFRWSDAQMKAIKKTADRIKEDIPEAYQDSVTEILNDLNSREFKMRIVAEFATSSLDNINKAFRKRFIEAGTDAANAQMDATQKGLDKIKDLSPWGGGDAGGKTISQKETENLQKFGSLMRKQNESDLDYQERIRKERQKKLDIQATEAKIIAANTGREDEGAKAVLASAQEQKKAADDWLDAASQVEKWGGYDFSTKKENTAATKAQHAAETELQKALKDELQLIDRVRSQYKKLVDAGANSGEALAYVTNQFGNSLARINSILGKNGIPLFDISKFAGTDNPQALLDMLKLQLDSAKVAKNIKPEEIKELEVKYSEIVVDAKAYNLSKITKGLNNELDKLKEEYELAVALDADPELGNMFADWMGIDVNDLPRTASEYAERASKELNSKLKELGANIELPNLLSITDDDMRAFEQSKTLTQAQLELVKKRVGESREFYRKETDDRIKNWDKLLEKYSEYEYKIRSIENNAAKERRDLVMKAGNEDEKRTAIDLHTDILEEIDPQARQILINKLSNLATEVSKKNKTAAMINVAIGNRETQDKAKTSFEEFQKTPEWIVATGDLANMSKSAIGMLIEELERYKRTAKNLSPKEIKQLNNALSKLYKEQRKNNPFKAVANMLDEAKERMSIFDEEIEETQKQIDELSKKHKTNLIDGIADDDTQKKLKEAKERLGKLKEERDNMGKIDASTWVSSINETISAVKSAIEVFDGLAKAIGGVGNSDVDKVFSILDSAGKGASTGSAFGGYGAIIGGVVGAAAGVVNAFADVWSGNESINKSIDVSTQKVMTLEREYKRLERAVNDAYGTDAIGAQRLMMLNKEAELAELERQLELEESREAKNIDIEKIDELRGKVEELRYEVDNAAREIILDLLEIGDAQDWANDFVKGMIDAFREGENYMKSYEDAFREMVDNMIAKTIVGKVIGERIEQMIDNIKEIAKTRAESDPDVAAAMEALKKEEHVRDVLYAFRESGEFVPEESFDIVNERIKEAQKIYDEIYTKAVQLTPEDVQGIRESISSWKDDVKNEFDAYMDAFGVEFGSAKDSQQLSALQQGLQGVSEETAGAVEAYLNGMSQQAYLRNELLTQIRDAIMGTDSDIQLGVQGQMLLQLQNNYIIMQSIQSMMEGWTTPSGQGIRVELLS